MAEVVLSIKDSIYDNGDVIEAFSDYTIKRIYTQEECIFPFLEKDRRFKLNGSGLIEPDSLVEDYYRITKEYKIQRLSIHEAIIIRGDEQIRFKSNEKFLFDGKTVCIDIPIFFIRKLKLLKQNNRSGIPMFGFDNSKPWIYMGKNNLDEDTLDLVWDKIEEKSAKSRENSVYRRPSIGEVPTRNKLVVRTAPMLKQEEAAIKRPLYELDDNGEVIYYDDNGDISTAEFGSPKIIKRRAIKVNWEELLNDIQVTKEQVEDTNYRIGKEVQLDERVLYQSKDQEVQQDRSKLIIKDANNN